MASYRVIRGTGVTCHHVYMVSQATENTDLTFCTGHKTAGGEQHQMHQPYLS